MPLQLWLALRWRFYSTASSPGLQLLLWWIGLRIYNTCTKNQIAVIVFLSTCIVLRFVEVLERFWRKSQASSYRKIPSHTYRTRRWISIYLPYPNRLWFIVDVQRYSCRTSPLVIRSSFGLVSPSVSASVSVWSVCQLYDHIHIHIMRVIWDKMQSFKQTILMQFACEVFFTTVRRAFLQGTFHWKLGPLTNQA